VSGRRGSSDPGIYRLAESTISSRLMAFANRLPIPTSRLAVRVGQHWLSGHTLDRLLAILFWKFHLLEGFETRLVKELVQPGMGAVDIGANVGYYTLMLAGCVGDQGHVWAFEPEPRAFRSLTANVERNGYGERITAVERAVASSTGVGALYLSASNQGNHTLFQGAGGARGSVAVRTVSLDEFFPTGQAVDFLKIDVEGAETRVLQGAERVLSEQRYVCLLVELWPEGLRMAGSSTAELLAILRQRGLTLEHVDSTRQCLVRLDAAHVGAEALAGRAYSSILAWK